MKHDKDIVQVISEGQRGQERYLQKHTDITR